MPYQYLSVLVLYYISDVVSNYIKASVHQINKCFEDIMPPFQILLVYRFFLVKNAFGNKIKVLHLPNLFNWLV